MCGFPASKCTFIAHFDKFRHVDPSSRRTVRITLIERRLASRPLHLTSRLQHELETSGCLCLLACEMRCRLFLSISLTDLHLSCESPRVRLFTAARKIPLARCRQKEQRRARDRFPAEAFCGQVQSTNTCTIELLSLQRVYSTRSLRVLNCSCTKKTSMRAVFASRLTRRNHPRGCRRLE